MMIMVFKYKILKNDNVSKSDIIQLRKSVNWKPTYKGLQEAFRNSYCHYSIREGKRLIGSIRVISDKSLHAYLVDEIIHPAYQGKGLGEQLLKKVVTDLKKEKFSFITTTFDSKISEKMCKKCGFKIINGGIIIVS